MNRNNTLGRIFYTSVPHTRGDEPFLAFSNTTLTSVFPTPVGMNRVTLCV